MNVLSKLSRKAQITGGAAVVLLIGLLAFPWYYVSIGPFSASASAVQANGAWAAILALIILIALIVELAISRLSSTQLPDLPISWPAVEKLAAIAVVVLLAIKFVSHIGNFGWGLYADAVLSVALAYGAIGLSREGAASASEAVDSTAT